MIKIQIKIISNSIMLPPFYNYYITHNTKMNRKGFREQLCVCVTVFTFLLRVLCIVLCFCIQRLKICIVSYKPNKLRPTEPTLRSVGHIVLLFSHIRLFYIKTGIKRIEILAVKSVCGNS